MPASIASGCSTGLSRPTSPPAARYRARRCRPAPARDAPGEVLHDRGGRLDADVGGQQAGFQFVEQIVVDGLLAEEQAGHIFANAGAGFRQPRRRRAKKPSLVGASGAVATTGAGTGSGSGSASGSWVQQHRLYVLSRLHIGLDHARRLLFLRCRDRRFDRRPGLFDRFAVRLFSGGLLCRRGLRLCAASRTGLSFTGLGRRLLVVVGTKHGEGILKDAKRRQPGFRPENGPYPQHLARQVAKRGHCGRADCADTPALPDPRGPLPWLPCRRPAICRGGHQPGRVPTMPLMLRRAAALLLGAFYLPLLAAADSQPTHEFFLDNGLKVIVREDHRAPVVVSQLWYKVGSSYETAGQTGLSHALEHMMFRAAASSMPAKPRASCVSWAPRKMPSPATTTRPITRFWHATAWPLRSSSKPTAWQASGCRPRSSPARSK